MDDTSHNKSLVFLILIILAVSVVSVFSVYRYSVKRDYVLYERMECDKEIEECLSDEYGDYKEAYKNASEVPLCLTSFENTCEELASY